MRVEQKVRGTWGDHWGSHKQDDFHHMGKDTQGLFWTERNIDQPPNSRAHVDSLLVL